MSNLLSLTPYAAHSHGVLGVQDNTLSIKDKIIIPKKKKMWPTNQAHVNRFENLNFLDKIQYFASVLKIF